MIFIVGWISLRVSTKNFNAYTLHRHKLRFCRGVQDLSCTDCGTESHKINFVRQTISRKFDSKKTQFVAVGSIKLNHLKKVEHHIYYIQIFIEK